MSNNRKNKKKSKKSGNSGIDGAILKYIESKTKSGLKGSRILDHFTKKYTVDKIETAIMRLEKRGLVEISENGKISKKRFVDKPNEKLIGKLDLAKSGVGYVIIEGWENDIKIPKSW